MSQRFAAMLSLICVCLTSGCVCHTCSCWDGFEVSDDIPPGTGQVWCSSICGEGNVASVSSGGGSCQQ